MMGTPTSPQDVIRDQLAVMQRAMCNHQAAYQNFLLASASFDWVGAERHRLEVGAHLESVMDAYMAMNRAQEAMRGGTS